MGVMALSAGKSFSFKHCLRRPFSTPQPVSTALPVFIDQPMAPGAHFFHIDRHDSRSIIGRILVTVLNEMTIVTAIIGAVIQLDDRMGKLGTYHIGIWNSDPVSMAEKTIADHDLVYQRFTPRGLRGVSGGVKGLGGHLLVRGFQAGG